MNVKLNINSKLTELYCWTYNRERSRWTMPSSFCTFFWKMLIAVVLAPILWITYPVKRMDVVARFCLSLFLYGLMCLVGMAVALLVHDRETLVDILSVLGIFVAILLGLVALLGFIFFLIWSTETVKESDTVRDIVTIVQTKKESFMGKYCPKIEWYNDTTR